MIKLSSSRDTLVPVNRCFVVNLSGSGPLWHNQMQRAVVDVKEVDNCIVFAYPTNMNRTPGCARRNLRRGELQRTVRVATMATLVCLLAGEYR